MVQGRTCLILDCSETQPLTGFICWGTRGGDLTLPNVKGPLGRLQPDRIRIVFRLETLPGQYRTDAYRPGDGQQQRDDDDACGNLVPPSGQARGAVNGNHEYDRVTA